MLPRFFIIGILLTIIILAAIFGTTYLKKEAKKAGSTIIPPTISVTPTTIKYKASFTIFTNGTFRIFTDPRYHNLSTDVFIEDGNPNVVNIKKAGTTWDDFFKTLPMELTKECLTTGTGQAFCSGENGTLKFYINGELEPNALSKGIKEGDRLLVSFGNETETQIEEQLQKAPDVN